MTMKKHTPGPWVGFADQGKLSAIMPAMREGDVCTFKQSPSDADGNLMLAAPDLLKQLKLMVELFDGHQGMELRWAKDAIAKAEGAA